MQHMQLASFDLSEMTMDEMQMIDGGGPGKALKWVGEQVLSWGIGEACSKALNYVQNHKLHTVKSPCGIGPMGAPGAL